MRIKISDMSIIGRRHSNAMLDCCCSGTWGQVNPSRLGVLQMPYLTGTYLYS